MQEYDKFVSNPDIPPKAPTALSFQMQTRAIQNYSGSGWNGYEKHTFFPMLTWTPPSQDISGNTLPSNFGGYVIERATQLSANASTSGNSMTAGNTIVSNWTWGTIASIPSYIGALGKSVNYFYDYSSASVLDQYTKAGYTGNSVTLQYRITAMTKKGSKSTTTSPISISISYPQYFDISGNRL